MLWAVCHPVMLAPVCSCTPATFGLDSNYFQLRFLMQWIHGNCFPRAWVTFLAPVSLIDLDQPLTGTDSPWCSGNQPGYCPGDSRQQRQWWHWDLLHSSLGKKDTGSISDSFQGETQELKEKEQRRCIAKSGPGLVFVPLFSSRCLSLLRTSFTARFASDPGFSYNMRVGFREGICACQSTELRALPWVTAWLCSAFRNGH